MGLELVRSQAGQQEALTRLFVEKGIFTKEEVLEMVKLINSEMKRKLQYYQRLLLLRLNL